MKDHWISFKNVVYILGWTYMVAHLSWLNYVIITYLVTVNPTHALISTLLTTALYPIWVIGLLGIIREWKWELSHDKQKEDISASSGG